MNRVKSYYRENRAIFQTIFFLSWPAVVEQALQTLVQYIDTAMVGRLGAQASAAVGLTSTMTWLVNAPLFAMGIGVLSSIAESIGAGEGEKARRYGIQSLYFAVALGLILGILMVGISPFLPVWLGADPELYRDASLYFGICCSPMIFRAFSVILGSVMRGAGDTRSPMIANILMNLTNIVLNFFLIYDTRPVHPGGLALTIPGAGLGVVGAAIGTAVSYCVGGIFMIVVYWRNRILSPKGYPLHFDRSLAAKCLRIGTPVAMERISACLGQVVFTSLVTRLGTLALATHSIAITAEQAFYIPGYGMQAAASTMAGNALGKQDEKEFRQVTKTIAAIAVALMTVTGALLFAFPGQMMSLFTEDAQVIAGGITVLRIVAVSEPMFAALIIFEGVFNGIGDTRAPFVFSIISMWGVRIAGTCLCVIFLHAGLELVWVCMVGDNVTRCLLLGHRFVRGSRSKDRAWRKRFGSGTMKKSEK